MQKMSLRIAVAFAAKILALTRVSENSKNTASMTPFAFLFITLPWLNPFSPGPTAAVGPLLFSWVCAAMVLLAFALDRQRGQHPHMVRAIALAWVTAAALNALIGLLQYFGATAPFDVWLNHTGLGEAYGNLRQRNQYATLLNIGLVAVILAGSQPACSAISL